MEIDKSAFRVESLCFIKNVIHGSRIHAKSRIQYSPFSSILDMRRSKNYAKVEYNVPSRKLQASALCEAKTLKHLLFLDLLFLDLFYIPVLPGASSKLHRSLT